MKHRTCLIVIGVLVVTLFSVSAALAATHAWVPDPPNRNVPGELLVGFQPHSTSAHIRAAVSSIGGSIKAQLSAPKGSVVRVKLSSTDPSAVEAAINQLKSNSAFKNVIRYVEPNVIRKAFGAWAPGGGARVFSQSNDQLLSNQWGYYDIGAQLINAPSTTSGVTVAVIDTGVDYNHPDLTGKVTKGYDYVNADSDPMDDMGHGTHVAGIIAAKANNNYGIAGVSWNAKILAIKVLDSNGYGSDYDVNLGIYAAANNSSVKVINMSMGGPYSDTEYDAVEYAVMTKGKLLVAAAGNDNTSDTTNAYPAALSLSFPGRVLAVAAHDQAHCRAAEDQPPPNGLGPFSNYGSWVSISAPGYDILSTVPISVPTPWSYDGYYFLSGTSMAAPHVSGAAALAWQQYPSLTNLQIASLITSNASTAGPLNVDGTCWPVGTAFGRLDVLEMLETEYYQVCDNKGRIYGYAFDAETGLPLAGAKVTATQGSTITGINYVPDYGETTQFGPDTVLLTGYGLFNVLTNAGNTTLTIQESKYMTFSPKDQNGLLTPIPVTACFGSYAGTIPVPPAKSLYWLVVTWDYGYTGTFFELGSDVYDKNNNYLGSVYNGYTGDLNTSPYMRFFWDSASYAYTSDLRGYSEGIRISKITTGWQYLFYVYDATVYPSSSSNWGLKGLKAYLYKGSTLVKTYTAPAGSGVFWIICEIVGNTIIDGNYLQ